MGYSRQFDKFDPLIGLVPYDPFARLESIVTRARKLLNGRTRDEIIVAAHNDDWMIDEYFNRKRDDYIRTELDKGGLELKYLPAEQQTETGISDLLDNWPLNAEDPPPRIPSPENTSDLDALKECISSYALDDTEFQNGHEYEYIAVLALWLAANAIENLKYLSNSNPLSKSLNDSFAPMSSGAFPEITDAINNAYQESKKGIRDAVKAIQSAYLLAGVNGMSETSIILVDAGRASLEAMDAVCYAEHLQAVEVQNEDIAKLRNELHTVGLNVDALAQEKANKKISMNASQAAVKRHTCTKEKRQEIIDYWLEHIYPDNPKMSNEKVAEWLNDTFPKLSHRKIGEYIAKAKKEMKSLPPAGKA